MLTFAIPMIPAPMSYRDKIGPQENYFIHEKYEVRLKNETFDDRPFKDEFQKEVYQYARQVLDAYSFRRVLDVGCGSGFKLMHNFIDCQTIGVELAEFIPFLEEKYPGRQWVTVSEAEIPGQSVDLIICSDVIEHIPEPNALLETIKLWHPQRIVLSTPERDQLCFGTHDGPPRNLHHVREWNYKEFDAYIGSHFQIKEHFVINNCQIVDCAL